MTGAVWADRRRAGCAAIPAMAGLSRVKRDRWDRAAALVAIILLLAFAHPMLIPDWAQSATHLPEGRGGNSERSEPVDAAGAKELLVAAYVGNPVYYRSNVRLTRPDGTDLELKGLGWDGDALYFPIDGGVRAIRWGGMLGGMIDFMHNKAIARLGKGAHGRKLKYPVVEEVPASGMLKGKPAPERVRLTDIFDRLEFTHGHNLLLFTGMFRFASPIPSVRPYAGLGAGFAIPHTEIYFTGEPKSLRTSEYQYAGPAAQALFGLELQVGRMSYFIEYKFSYAWLRGVLTGDKSWQDWSMPADLLRQFMRWWRGEEPKLGRFSTTLGAHQIIAGAGYRWGAKAVPQTAP